MAPLARVIVVAGPSGTGKSFLAARLARALTGLTVVRLDDFYRDADAPNLPRSPIGIVDWDDPATWDADAAAAALQRLCTTGTTDLPVYDIPTSRATGTHTVRLDGARLVLAEGLFADCVVDRLRAAGLLADALCVRRPALVTFARRLRRDLAQRRKPPRVLVRRGVALLRAEPGVIDRCVRNGCTPVTGHEFRRRVLRRLSDRGGD